tara:strand:+ start:42 stop:953 length:912 start_codon:yes stop_codon:yes gene_type:complete
MANDTVTSAATNTALTGTSSVGKATGKESALSNWVGPYVTNMLGKGQALSELPYEAYTGPLTAGASAPQTQAFQGVANLTVPTQEMGAFTPQEFTSAEAASRINPFIQNALDPQIADMRRQAEIQRIENAGRLSQAGAYGGGRQAVMEGELSRGLLDRVARTRGEAQLQAYNDARSQFNLDQDRERAAQTLVNDYGLAALQKQAALGEQQRAIEAQGIAADKAQFEEERANPYKMVQFQQQLLDKLPLATQNYSYAQPSALQNILSGASGSASLLSNLTGTAGGGIMDLVGKIFGGSGTTGTS